MTEITAAIDGVNGTIKVIINNNEQQQQLDFDWCNFDEEGTKTGFVVSFSELPVMVTELAAEQFIRTVLFSLLQSYEVDLDDFTIINHLGEKLQDVQFLPPTCKLNESEIINFVEKQEVLKRVFSSYENSGELSSEFMQICEDEGILDDVLSLIQIRASGFVLSVKKPTTEEEKNG